MKRASSRRVKGDDEGACGGMVVDESTDCEVGGTGVMGQPGGSVAAQAENLLGRLYTKGSEGLLSSGGAPAATSESGQTLLLIGETTGEKNGLQCRPLGVVLVRGIEPPTY
jgi:hypothetical protein